MDLAYWGFRNWPFERSFVADRFFASPAHDEAFARLLFLVEESRRTGIVIGPSGTGKSYLLKLLQLRADRLGRLTVRCDATGIDGNELVSQIASACHVQCDLDAKAARIWNALHARFAALALVQQPIVVMIDHFDPVEASCQQSVGRLHQLADAVGAKLTVILATRDHVLPTMVQDLVELRIEIPPWTAAETSQFISAAITRAGSKSILFTDEALASIYDSTHGLPARVVTLCNLALVAAMGQSETLITRELVEEAHRELMPRFNEYATKHQFSLERPIVASMTR